jgi:hypothetical protein
MQRALLIEFDLSTGKRAGDISPKDPKLPCYGWQDLDSEPAKELRLVMDDRDLSIYEGVPGVTILDNPGKINQAIRDNFPARFNVQDSTLMLEHLRQRNISLDDYSGWDTQAILNDLHGKGIVGIKKREAKQVKE